MLRFILEINTFTFNFDGSFYEISVGLPEGGEFTIFLFSKTKAFTNCFEIWIFIKEISACRSFILLFSFYFLDKLKLIISSPA